MCPLPVAPPVGLLIGVGVGPGDPELVTLQALRVLREADVIVVPVRDDRDEIGYAEAIVRAHLLTGGDDQSNVSDESNASDSSRVSDSSSVDSSSDSDGINSLSNDGEGAAGMVQAPSALTDRARIVRAPFALTDRSGVSERRTRAWETAAALILEAFDQGASTVAFATIGDPNIYSTFSYLAATVLQTRPDVEIRTVPGITAMQALAAASGTVLCEGSEPLVLFPALGGASAIDEVLQHGALAGATVVAYKGGRHWPDMRETLAAHGRLDTAVVGSHLGRPDQALNQASAVLDEIPYLSTVIAPSSRTTRGGKLA